MRQDPAGSLITSRIRDPRIVIGIIYASGSIYLTNRKGLSNVPGTVVQGCVTEVSTTSQTLAPDERRTTIGTLSFKAVDLGSAITSAVRTQLLTNLRGVKRREVRVFTGDTDDFNDYVRVETYVVDGVRLDGLTYEFSCSDRSREQRVDIFDQATTRLTASISASDTTINVVSAAAFSMLAHTASFTDAPSSTVGYVLIEQTKEVIRYTGKTGTSFTGCTRGVFGTTAQAVTLASSDQEKRPLVKEFIYLEMPAPQLKYALQTGSILGTANSLPSTWHMGIATSNVDSVQYQRIGADLYDQSDVTAGLVLRFVNLEKVDGKAFCEQELDVPMGTFAPISTMGVIGLRRIASLVGNAGYSDTLDASSVLTPRVSITHALARVRNQIVVNWNWDGDKFTRTNVFVNATSIGNGDTGHGETPPLVLELKGLTVQRHTEATLRRIANYFFERYASPPITTDLKVSRSKNAVEIGDVVKLTLDGVRDFAGASTLSRAFEVQSRRVNWATGDLQLTLFGSTSRVQPDAGSGVTSVLADAYYGATGTALTSVLTIVAGHVTVNGSLTGGADARTSVFYYVGNLTIDAGVTVSISDNVTLLVRGSLTINGKIDGKGRGLATIADPNTVGSAYVEPSIDYTSYQSTLGITRGSAGVISLGGGKFIRLGQRTLLGVPTMPQPALALDANSYLTGLPAELRGTPGIYGAPVCNYAGPVLTVRAKGGAGGAGGAGLVIVSRGALAFGVSGQIDLSGTDGTSPSGTTTQDGHALYPGAGCGGAPGGLLWVGDGDSITLPDTATKLLVSHGTCVPLGNPIEYIPSVDPAPADPWTGSDQGIGVIDMYDAAHVLTYAPSGKTGSSDDEVVVVPANLTATTDATGVAWSWEPGPVDKSDYTELWVATSNDRTGAVLVSSRKSSTAFVASAPSVTRYGWVRNFKDGLGWSSWYPTSPTGGVTASYGGGANQPPTWTPVLVNVSRNGNTYTKTDSTGYTAQVYSQERFNAFTVSTRGPDTTNLGVMYGINQSPATDASYTAIDYCFAYQDNGHLAIYENGVAIADLGTYSASAGGAEPTSITYDGLMIRYYRGATLVRTVWSPGQSTYLDSSFHGAGVVLNQLMLTPIDVVLINPNGKKYINQDPGTTGAGYWMTDSGTNWEVATITDGKVGNSELRSVASAAHAWVRESQSYPVDPSKPYKLHAWVRRKSGNRGVYLVANFFDSSGALIAGSAIGWLAYGSSYYWGLANADTTTLPADSVWREYTAEFGFGRAARIPSNAKTMNVGAILNYQGSGTTDGVVAVQDLWVDLADNVVPEFGMVLSTGMARSGRSFVKTDEVADATWNASVRSVEGFAACEVSFQPAQTNKNLIVGLNSDPATDDNYTSIDYAFDCDNAGIIYAYGSGSLLATIGTYAAGDTLSVDYDGQTVRWKKNGVTLFSKTAVGQILYLDSSFYNVGAQVNNLTFGKIAVQNPVAGDGWSVDYNGKPAGFRGVEGVADQSAVSFASSGRVQIVGSSNYAYGLPAIAVDASRTYTLFVRHRSTGAAASGLYVRFNEKSGALAAGKSHIGGGGTQETVTDTRTSYVDMVSNGAMPGTSLIESVYTYTPTAGAKFACLSFYNWSSGVTYEVESVRMVVQGTMDDVLVRGAPLVDLTTQILGQLSTAFAAAGLINTNISVNANGSLTGAGGGSPTISSISGSVTTGQLTTNVLAALQAVIGNLSAISADIGTITAGKLNLSSSTFTPTWSGFSSDPTGTISYVDVGAFVIMWSSTSAVGTSNATTMSVSGIPSAIRPGGLRQIPTHVMDNGLGSYAAYVQIDSSGNMNWYRHKTESGTNPQAIGGGGTFTSSGSKDWPAGQTIVYAK